MILSNSVVSVYLCICVSIHLCIPLCVSPRPKPQGTSVQSTLILCTLPCLARMGIPFVRWDKVDGWTLIAGHWTWTEAYLDTDFSWIGAWYKTYDMWAANVPSN